MYVTLRSDVIILIKIKVMIEGISNILRMAYFSQLKKQSSSKRGFTKKNRPNRVKHIKWQVELNELSDLIHSEEQCEHWIVLLDTHKHNYIVQSLVYKCTMEGTIMAHNLFLALIQCRVLPPSVWIPIESICVLKGARKHEHCCIIHFTVANMACGTEYNPTIWNRTKTEKELGQNFMKLFPSTLPIDQKVSILPMLTLLAAKNARVLWQRLQWLQNFPLSLISHMKANMLRILQPGFAETINLPDPDPFSLQMCLKSVQLAESINVNISVEGFVSGKNLFSYSFNLYNVSMVLELLALCDTKGPRGETLRIVISDFLIELLDCLEVYEYDLAQNPRNLQRLNSIITNNRLYLLELNDIHFINQYVRVEVDKYQGKRTTGSSEARISGGSDNSFSVYLCRAIPQCDSRMRENDPIEFQEMNGEEIYSNFLRSKKDTILTHLLGQIYDLKIDFLQILHSIMKDCYHKLNEEPSWSEPSSSFYKLQLYLIYNHLPEFLIQNFNSLEGYEKSNSMIAFYGVLGYLARLNPIAYGKFDNILQSQQINQGGRIVDSSQVKHFVDSFTKKKIMSYRTVFMLLSDYFEWNENNLQKYPNAGYQSLFFTKVILKRRQQWMTMLCEMIGCFHAPGCPSELLEKEDKYEWVTFFLTMAYLFEGVSERSKDTKINKLIEKEKYITTMYPIPALVRTCCQINDCTKLLEAVLFHLQEWEKLYEKVGKNRMMEVSLNYVVLKEQKARLRNKMRGFMKRKKFEEMAQFQ